MAVCILSLCRGWKVKFSSNFFLTVIGTPSDPLLLLTLVQPRRAAPGYPSCRCPRPSPPRPLLLPPTTSPDSPSSAVVAVPPLSSSRPDGAILLREFVAGRRHTGQDNDIVVGLAAALDHRTRRRR
jgi:hypothetical protein